MGAIRETRAVSQRELSERVWQVVKPANTYRRSPSQSSSASSLAEVHAGARGQIVQFVGPMGRVSKPACGKISP
jgi:hypothetical protein